MKNILKILFGLLIALAGFFSIRLLDTPENLMRALPYLLIGAGCGLLGHGAGELGRAYALGKDPALQKQLDIEAKDERNVQLANAAKAKAFDLMNYIYAALMLAFALTGESLWVVLPLVAAYLFIEGYAIYQRMKLEREG